MKALPVRQPWADCIIYQHNDVATQNNRFDTKIHSTSGDKGVAFK